MRLTKFKMTYILVALAIATLLLALALLASNPQAAHADTASPTASPSPTATASPTASPSPTVSPSPTASPVPAPVGVTEKEFSITPVPPAVLVGPVQFNATNQGLITHELVVIKTDLAPDALPMRSTDSTKVDEEAAGTSIGEIEDIGPGQSASTVMNLPPGKYVLICNVENHYKAGMFAAFTVGSVAPTAVPSPTAAALPKSGGPPSDSTPVWIWLAAGLAVLGAATVWLRLTSKRSP